MCPYGLADNAAWKAWVVMQDPLGAMYLGRSQTAARIRQHKGKLDLRHWLAQTIGLDCHKALCLVVRGLHLQTSIADDCVSASGLSLTSGTSGRMLKVSEMCPGLRARPWGEIDP